MHSLEGQQPSLPDGRLSKGEESGLSGQAAQRASILLRSGIRFLDYGLRKAVGCWSLGSVPALSMPGRAWGASSLLIHIGLCDLRPVTGSTRSKSKDRESFWGFGHLGKVQE